MPEIAPPRLHALTSLRFFAAMLVVVGHIAGMSASEVVRRNSGHGGVGVSFFFILSGFVLTWSRSSEVGPWLFFRRRFARIYPMHALTWAIAVAVGLLGLGGFGSGKAKAVSLVLLQSWVPNLNVVYSANVPSWSLSDEALFYLLFPLAAVAVVRLSARMQWVALAAAGVLVVAVLPAVTGYYGLYVFPPTRLVEFLAGVLIASRIRDGWRCPVSVWPAVALLAASFAVLPFAPAPMQYVAVTAVPLALLIAAVATRELSGVPMVLTRPRLVTLGVWSFALYLIHNIVITVVLSQTGWMTVGELLPVGVAIAAGCVALSGVAYRWVEAPVERRLRGRGRVPMSLSAA